MDQRQIDNLYAKFRVPKESIPFYSDPYEFSLNFEICSALNYNIATFSSSSTLLQVTLEKDKCQVGKMFLTK